MLFIHNIDGIASTFFTFLFFVVYSFYSGGSLEDGDSEVADVTFESPTFFVVELETKMTPEAFTTEIKTRLFAIFFYNDF